MAFDPKQHHRRSIRVPSHCYSDPGWYFVTICTKDRRTVFGEIVGRRVSLNAQGIIVRNAITDISNHYHSVAIDSYVIMPNHVHVVILIKHQKRKQNIVPRTSGSAVGAGLRPAPTRQEVPLSEIVRAIKSFSSRRINECSSQICFQWQRNYYERIVRSYRELEGVRMYIRDNPLEDHVN